MEHRYFMKVCKSLMAMSFALVLILNGWALYELHVLAEEEDHTVPTVEAVYPECTYEEAGVKYYRPMSGETEEILTLIFTEAYYGKQADASGDPVRPVLHIYKDGAEEDITPYTKWGTFESNQIAVDITLPYDTLGAETEYKITASYSEGYISGTFVLDNQSPKLTDCTIAGDVTITFVVEEKEAYWNPKEWKLTIVDEEDDGRKVADIQGDDAAIVWSSSTESQTGVYTFAGETEKASRYAVLLSYTDKAGNVLILDPTNPLSAGSMDQGVYTSESFILDHAAPVLDMAYTEPVQEVDDISYYADSFEITFEVQEDYVAYVNGTDVTDGLEECVLELYKDGSLIQMPEVAWREENHTYTGTFQIRKDADAHSTDGAYQFYMTYQDTADNKADFESSVLVLDTIAPQIAVSYEVMQGDCSVQNTFGGRDYYNQAMKMVLQVKDANGRYQELQDVLETASVTDAAGNMVTGSFQASVAGIDPDSRTSVSGIVWEFDLSTEANYTILLEYKDLAGNEVHYADEKLTIDTTEPEIELTYEADPSIFLDAVNYLDTGFVFADGKMTIKLLVKDETAGIWRIRYTITDENGKTTDFQKEFAPSEKGIYEISIPLETADFKGSILAEVFDWSQNHTDLNRGYIVESTERHKDTGSVVITTQAKPSRTVKGEKYYNKDVKFNLTFKDTYSGLGKWSYKGGNTLSGSMDYAKAAGSDLSQSPTDAITYEYSKDMTLSASSNNENDIKVTAEYTDNTGHTGKTEAFYNIDVTKPTITVEYDLEDPVDERFFRQARTAKVTIRERNFDKDDVEFTITNTAGKMPSISGWESSGSGDSAKHVCYVTFYADGDYTFTVAFQDLAGNEADYDRVDNFTIDQTKPVLHVTYNNNQSENEFYYNRSRTATIDILEHNFDPAFIDVQITADGASVPSVSRWSRDGDHNVATVTFQADADYTFDIFGTDQAENPLDDYTMDRFVIDQTAPDLEIFDIVHMSANNGEVRPGIRFNDTNINAENTIIHITGYHNGEVKIDGTLLRTSRGMEIKLDDFAYVQELDDLYTMEAAVYDLAGNHSEASVTFSVNRFGSVYAFDDVASQLLDAYYTNQAKKLTITETNVDTLEFKEIICNLNGNLRTLTEGKDYTVRMEGSEASWKQYVYEIQKENFEEEGTYILTIYSEDRAANASDNHTKGKKIEFAVDRTSPSILVSGVEDEGQYRENSREITLDVQDNIRLAEVEVWVDGEKYTYDASDLQNLDGKITIAAKSANHWQTLTVAAKDLAGNGRTLESFRFLVTSDLFIQLFLGKYIHCFLLAVGIIILLSAYFVHRHFGTKYRTKK